MEKYCNIRIILDRLMRHPLLQDITLEAVVDYTVDFMRIVGAPNIFTNKEELIEISDYRGKLPCDWYETIQIKNTKTCRYLRYATGTFLSKLHQGADETFSIQGDIIYTSSKDTVLEMAYRAILIDEDGLPLIPDNSKFYRALEAYIKIQWFTILFDLGKVTPASFQLAQQDYAWAVGACETDLHKLDMSKAESLLNSMKTLLIRSNEFNKGFIDTGTRENIKTH